MRIIFSVTFTSNVKAQGTRRASARRVPCRYLFAFVVASEEVAVSARTLQADLIRGKPVNQNPIRFQMAVPAILPVSPERMISIAFWKVMAGKHVTQKLGNLLGVLSPPNLLL
jgi:hypothetical protein